MLVINNLTKYFLKPIPFYKKLSYCLPGKIKDEFKQTVLKDINISVRKGEILGIFGKNGAGKTTLLKIICNIIIQDKGIVLIDKKSNFLNLKKTGLVLNNKRSFYWRLTGFDNLIFFGRLYDLSFKEVKQRIDEIDAVLDLKETLFKRFDSLSGGMKQKLNLARALLHKPDILFLDEPTVNLDIVNQQKFLNYIKDIKEKFNLTILWVSHHLEEIESICESILILDEGKIVWRGDAKEFKKKFFNYSYVVTLKNPREGGQEVRLNNLDEIRSRDILKDNIESLELKKEFVWNNIEFKNEPGEEKSDILLKEFNSVKAKERTEAAAVRRWSFTFLYRKTKRLFSLYLLFFKKDFKIEKNYKLSFTLDIFGVLFSSLSFYFISKLFYKNDISFDFASENYFAFVLVGLAFLGFINTSLGGFSLSLRKAQVLGIIEQILISPISILEYLFSSNSYFFFLSSFRFFVYLTVGLFLGVKFYFNLFNLLWVAIIFLLTVGVFSSIGIISSSFIMIFKRGDPIDFFMGNLMGLLGGVYYPVKILPFLLKLISYLIPLTYALKGIRLCLFSSPGFLEIFYYIKILLLFFLILFPLSLYLYKRALIKAKKEGTLSFY